MLMQVEERKGRGGEGRHCARTCTKRNTEFVLIFAVFGRHMAAAM